MKVGLLIFSIVSVIGYATRRADDRAAKHALLEKMPVVRTLSADELNALSQFLIHAVGKSASVTRVKAANRRERAVQQHRSAKLQGRSL